MRRRLYSVIYSTSSYALKVFGSALFVRFEWVADGELCDISPRTATPAVNADEFVISDSPAGSSRTARAR
jgi:hypothetical protein